MTRRSRGPLWWVAATCLMDVALVIYAAHNGDWLWALWFAVLVILCAVSLVGSVRGRRAWTGARERL